MGSTGTSDEPIPLRRDKPSEVPAERPKSIGEGPPTPEEIARDYIRQYGSFSDPEAGLRSRRFRFAALILIIVIVLGGASFGVVRSGVFHRSTQPPKPPLVKVIQDLPKSLVTFNVRLSTFFVKVVAYGGPTSVTQGSNVISLPQQGNDQIFTVRHNLTIVTANSSARVALYEKFKLIGFYFPTTGPFTLTFHALGTK
jgi:hypothetical protein